MEVALFVFAFGWTCAMAASRIAFLAPGGAKAVLAGAPAWRAVLAATLVVAEAAMAVWAFLALPLVMAAGVLLAGLAIAWFAVTRATLAAVHILKPGLDLLALVAAAFLWATANPLG